MGKYSRYRIKFLSIIRLFDDSRGRVIDSSMITSQRISLGMVNPQVNEALGSKRIRIPISRGASPLLDFPK